ncbi:two-component sensor histidine kinase [Marinomonas piezotolerans]|uniref:histidine kinase n=1 Tax=Marinomonas piezotolerans TaxID=2213058 RepID=A0A370U758_9GAMM|nr:ATP-binding protein [Marinomonas piezotolerans]RDL43608.1 two-component sensor histidine kinase [Marinomonas piezotolerans]
MRSDIWRLYRHILIGGAIILLVCYGAIEFIQSRYESDQIHRYMNSDVELSAQLLSKGVFTASTISQYSRFNWQVLSEPEPLLTPPKIKWLTIDSSESVRVFNEDTLFLEGELKPVEGFSVASLLRYYLHSAALVSAKLETLQSLTYINLTEVNPSAYLTSSMSGIDMIQLNEGTSSILWLDADDSSWLISIELGSAFSLGGAVILIIIISIAALLILIWVELTRLDQKRVHFETVTRQIARGRSSLPQGVVDSSGTLKELAYSFDSMSSHIQRLLKVQREMINAISHELRTPIARLRFGLEALKDDVTEEQEASVSALEIDVEELNTLVDEVLTYGKLEEGSLALNFEQTSIRQLLNGIVDHNQPLLQRFDVRVEVSDDDIVTADAHHLHRALQNLILNASKYANSIIAITFTVDNERWQVDIEDDGPGIPVEDRDKVFIPFQRLDNSRTRASGGYGLGLAIVQRIAFWHGGAVLVDGSELGGAKFSLIWSRSQHQNSLS